LLQRTDDEVIAACEAARFVVKKDACRDEAAVCGGGGGIPCGVPCGRAAMHPDASGRCLQALFCGMDMSVR
jgi:hypothetical protein